MTTKETVIDAESVAKLFGECVAKRGRDYTHPRTRCVYFEYDGTPSCAVGWMLNRVEVTAQTFEDMGSIPGKYQIGGGVVDPNDARFELLWEHLEMHTQLRFTEHAVQTIALIQSEQDGMTPYGEILDMVKDEREDAS
jgi:hypothetical protein